MYENNTGSKPLKRLVQISMTYFVELYNGFLYPVKDYNINLLAALLYKITILYSYTIILERYAEMNRLWLPRGQLNMEVKTIVCLKLHTTSPRTKQF